ncbi:hypothetical protein J2X36_003774 [Methylobacterium sp. BE186]|uniref:hypothetical protein n=1 Tax=Methylobacterium sp. BE186 TaxID=2817715 RepID=UPI002856D900|nr:hypothetical protein [Methylobacterium sp. BE186]MDR7039002.1 hypothetical protein [Methylobacterium sp. BE186]
MRNLSIICGLLATGPAWAADLALAPAAPPAFEPAWTTTFNTEFRYFSFSGTKGQPTGVAPLGVRGSGTQFYLPFGLAISGQPSPDLKIDLTARGGYVDSRQGTPGLSGSVRTALDTQLSATATYLGIDGVQPFASINMNLPTGESYLAGTRFLARLDSDLVDVPTFGEGLNFGPSVGVNVPLGQTMLFNLTLGYTTREPFFREGPPDPFTGIDAFVETKSGDTASVTASLAYEEGPWSGNLAVVYSQDGTTFVDRAPLIRSGERVGISGQVGYAWAEAWLTTLSASFNNTQRNFVPNAVLLGLVAEPRNSNSNLYRVGLDTLYRRGSFALGPTLSYLYRDVNSYDPTTFQFLPARERYGAGGTLQYTLTETVSLSLRGERIFVREAVNPDKEPFPGFGIVPGTGQPRLSYTGWSIGGGATIRF